MNDYQKLVAANMRLLVLTALNQDADYSHNEHVLRSFLEASGHKIARDKLHTELAWLAEQGLVSTNDMVGMIVAKLTARGKDVAEGAAVVPGVKRPEPEA